MKKRPTPGRRPLGTAKVRSPGVKRVYARDVLKLKLGERVVIHGKARGDTVIERLPSGHFTTPASAARIDETVTDFSVVLEELAKR